MHWAEHKSCRCRVKVSKSRREYCGIDSSRFWSLWLHHMFLPESCRTPRSTTNERISASYARLPIVFEPTKDNFRRTHLSLRAVPVTDLLLPSATKCHCRCCRLKKGMSVST